MTSLQAANYVIAYSDSKGEKITNKKLQKLLYYLQAWNLAVFGDSLFSEVPQAWRHGPVYPTVYHAFKGFGAENVSLAQEYTRLGVDEDGLLKQIAEGANLKPNQIGLIQEVMTKYGTQSAIALEILSHRERPWLEARKGLDDFDSSEEPITHDSMRHYYSSLRRKKPVA